MAESDSSPTEWTDDRVQQGTLGTEDPTQYRDSKIDEGTDEFADDRADVYDPAEDVGDQASLLPEEVGDGQQALSGETAEISPTWDDDIDDGDSSSDGLDPVAERIEFATLDAANEWRDVNEEFLHPDDTRRTKTVAILAEAPENVLNDAGQAAEISRSDERKKYGQSKLSDDEREKLERMHDNWAWGEHGFEAMSAKAALVEEGASDWLNYYEPGEGVDGSLANLEAGKERQAAGQGSTGIRNQRVDTADDPGEIGRKLDQGQGEACSRARDACEDGYEDACRALLEDCGWSEGEIDDLLAVAERMGEDPNEIYDPAAEGDSGQSFEDWARQNAPEPPEPEKPVAIEEPSDEELARLAPTTDDEPAQAQAELTGPAYRALKKAWSGYKLARKESREAHQEAEQYAKVINGIRAVNGQEPIDFNDLEWDGGPVLPDDPSEEFPAPEGGTETMEEAAAHGHAGSVVQQTLGQISERAGNVIDPMEGM